MHAPRGAAWPSPRTGVLHSALRHLFWQSRAGDGKSGHVNSDDHSLRPWSTCTEYSAYDCSSTNLFVDETRSGRRDVEEVYIEGGWSDGWTPRTPADQAQE